MFSIPPDLINDGLFLPAIAFWALSTIATLSLTGLLAIWGGLGRTHWFLRVLVVGAVVGSWLIIPVWELVLLLGTQSAVTIAVLMLVRDLRARSRKALSSATGGLPGSVAPGGLQSTAGQASRVALSQRVAGEARFRPQFYLSDLLLLTVVVSGVFAVLAQAPLRGWEAWLKTAAAGAVLAFFTLAAAWVALDIGRSWRRIAFACLVFPSALMVAWLVLMRQSGVFPGKALPNRQIKRLAKVALLLLSLSILLPPAAAYYLLMTPMPIPEVAFRGPNSIGRLLNAADLLYEVEVPADDASPEAFLAFEQERRATLRMARTALEQPCWIAINYSNPDHDLARTQRLRALARALWASGNAAEIRGDFAAAAQRYSDVIRLGDAATRGGVVIELLVGCAIQSLGDEHLYRLRDSLSADPCRDLLAELSKLDAGREPAQNYIVRDRALWENTGSWHQRLIVRASRARIVRERTEPLLDRATRRTQARMQLLLCALALRLYDLEHAGPPSRLADLVPDYLPQLPRDPYSGKPLVYRRQPVGYLLYSVGRDGVDDGGQPMNLKTGLGDFLLDKPADQRDGEAEAEQ